MPQYRKRDWLPGRRAPREDAPHDGEEIVPERSMDPRAGSEVTGEEASGQVIDMAIYTGGRRSATPTDLSGVSARVPEEPGAFVWVSLLRPTESQMSTVSTEFELHELAVEDTIVAHQRPKIERYNQTLFVVLKPARYRDDTARVQFGEIHIFLGQRFALTVRHSDVPQPPTVRQRLESKPDLLTAGPESVLYALLDTVVDGYAPVVAGLQNDIDDAESRVFEGAPEASRRIYELSREVIEFQRATRSLLTVLNHLTTGSDTSDAEGELRRYLRDVADHATTVAERADGFRQMLEGILTVNATLVSQAQNEEMRRLSEAGYQQNEQVKKISSWAAILFAPTLVGTIYGMNFVHMPELRWSLGYPFSLVLMAGVCLTLYLIFKRSNWL